MTLGACEVCPSKKGPALSSPSDPSPLVSSIDVSANSELSADPAATPATEGFVGDQLRDLVALSREMVEISREQLRYLRRTEERYQRQQHALREEFQRWLSEHRHLAGRCRDAHEALRLLLGQTISELVTYVEDNQENLLDSEFVRSDMIDRYGSLLNHVSAMHSVLKRLAAADQSNAESASEFSF